MDKKPYHLEDIMEMRHIQAPSSNLAERIIQASLAHQSQGRGGVDLWWRTFWDAFLLPRPAYVMAAIFAVGLFMGLYVDIVNTVDSDAVTSMLYTAEGVTEGDWL